MLWMDYKNMTYLNNDIIKILAYTKNSIVLQINNQIYYYNISDIEGILYKYSYPTKQKNVRTIKTNIINYLKDYQVDEDNWDRY